jgi:hypothetical protein
MHGVGQGICFPTHDTWPMLTGAFIYDDQFLYTLVEWQSASPQLNGDQFDDKYNVQIDSREVISLEL